MKEPRTYFTIAQAMDWFGKSRETIERNMVPFSDYQPPKGSGAPPVGKFRFIRATKWAAEQKPLYLLAEDVYAVLPFDPHTRREEAR